MRLLGLVLAASIISLSAGHGDDLEDMLPVQCMRFLDRNLDAMLGGYNYGPITKQAYPGYATMHSCCHEHEGNIAEGTSQSSNEISDSEETSYQSPGLVNIGDVNVLSVLLDQVSPSQPGGSEEECCEEGENAEDGSGKSEATSGEEILSGTSKEETKVPYSEEYRDRSVNG
ncbi:uncharacterized protein [Halyomorpha halys]|uniref:uncharacterized protein n=1 Tax=Halyomorpha halys TaxID=286706 RepID=UPI0034D2CF4B